MKTLLIVAIIMGGLSIAIMVGFVYYKQRPPIMEHEVCSSGSFSSFVKSEKPLTREEIAQLKLPPGFSVIYW